MNQKLKERLISCSLLLSLMISGCSNDKGGLRMVPIGDGKKGLEIIYDVENDTISGIFSANIVDQYIKIITFKQDDVVFTRLVGIEDYNIYGGRGGLSYRTTSYVDIETGTTLIHYNNRDLTGKTMDSVSYSVGEKLEIVSEVDIMPYLYQEEKFQDEYEINDIISFYHENLEDNLDSSLIR